MTITQFPAPLQLTADQDEDALRVLEILDFVGERYDDHYKAKRNKPRNPFRRKVLVFIPVGSQQVKNNPEEYSFEAWARNLSPGGISVIFPTQLHFERGVICLNPDAQSKRWVNFALHWSRGVAREFWEYGLKFQGRAEA